MNDAAYTPESMEIAHGRSELRAGRFDDLHAEAEAALAQAATAIRAIRARYRTAYRADVASWQSLSDDLVTREREEGAYRGHGADGTHGSDAAGGPDTLAAIGADREAVGMRAKVAELAARVGRQETELTRLEAVEHAVEDTWVLLEQGRRPGSANGTGKPLSPELAVRVVEAQEAERARLAQEIHDGPAQALSNAVFQVEYVERVLEGEEPLARSELRYLRELLRRELSDVRTYVSQLRPRVLDELGFDGAIRQTVDNTTTLAGIAIEINLLAPGAGLSDAQQTVVLRLLQEALQNIRKHASASRAWVQTRVEDDTWRLEIRDDGRGFDVADVAARGRRNFGLQFMRERAELIGARFEVTSRPGGGTVVWLAIPLQEVSR